MAYPQKEVDWISKEKRELFSKAVNSYLMRTDTPDIDKVLEIAKKIIDRAFELYPDANDSKKEIEVPL